MTPSIESRRARAIVAAAALSLSLGVVIAGAAAAATTPAPPAPAAAAKTAAAAPSAAAPKNTISHKLEVGEKITIAITQAPEFNVSRYVDATGHVDLMGVGPVMVYGLTVSDIQAAIKKAYVDGEILRNPEVKVTIETLVTRYVTVTGQIKGQGRIPMSPDEPMTLVDAILKAGGLNDMASGNKVTVTRVSDDGKTSVLGPFEVEMMISGKTKQSVPFLEPNDTIVVPMRMW